MSQLCVCAISFRMFHTSRGHDKNPLGSSKSKANKASDKHDLLHVINQLELREMCVKTLAVHLCNQLLTVTLPYL